MRRSLMISNAEDTVDLWTQRPVTAPGPPSTRSPGPAPTTSNPCTSNTGGIRAPCQSPGRSCSPATSGVGRRRWGPATRVAPRRKPRTSSTPTASSGISSPTRSARRAPRTRIRCSRLGEFGFTEATSTARWTPRRSRVSSGRTLRELVTALRRRTAARSASSTCASPTRRSASGSRSAWSRRATGPALTGRPARRILERLVAAETFEQFLHTKFVGQKRFSLEGGEALIPLLDTIVEEAAAREADEMVMGMPHRGRLNVLAHVLRKPYELILAEFEGTLPAVGRPGRRRRQVPPRLLARPLTPGPAGRSTCRWPRTRATSRR